VSALWTDVPGVSAPVVAPPKLLAAEADRWPGQVGIAGVTIWSHYPRSSMIWLPITQDERHTLSRVGDDREAAQSGCDQRISPRWTRAAFHRWDVWPFLWKGG
jgi:hypothetical protein